jgi:hypothetical protein
LSATATPAADRPVKMTEVWTSRNPSGICMRKG